MHHFSQLDSTDLEELHAGALQAMQHLQMSNFEPPPSSTILLAAADEHLAKLLSVTPSGDDPDVEELAFELGCLWGEQLVSQLGWQWIRVQFNDHAPEAIGVSSKDASLVIYPFQTIFLYHERLLPIRIARSFEILSEPGRVPMLPPGGLENVMDHIE